MKPNKPLYFLGTRLRTHKVRVPKHASRKLNEPKTYLGTRYVRLFRSSLVPQGWVAWPLHPLNRIFYGGSAGRRPAEALARLERDLHAEFRRLGKALGYEVEE